MSSLRTFLAQSPLRLATRFTATVVPRQHLLRPLTSSNPLGRRTYASHSDDANQFNAGPGKPAADDLARSPEARDMMEKMASSPGAAAAALRMFNVFKTMGIEVKPGEMPGKMDMMKLLVNAEFRDAAQQLGEELQKAGVKIDQSAVLEMAKAMSQGKKE